MARELVNVGASIRARLLERAREQGADFQLLLTRYALERLLYRLSLSAERERFILKGAMLFSAWLRDPFRPTQDLDLLGYGEADAAAVAQRVRSILAVEVPDDGVAFDTGNLTAAPIRDHAEYAGVRVRTTATIASAKVPIQIDVGFGDVITPEPIILDYPVLLDAPVPTLRAYPPETVVAEKFEALVTLGVANSRMKDFYDLWMIAQTFHFNSAILRQALHRTFERRGTRWLEATPAGLSDAFAADRQAMWQAFLTRERLGAAPASFADAVKGIGTFVLPLLKDALSARWQPGGPWTPP